VRNPVQDVQLFHRELVDFIQRVKARDVLAVALDQVNDVIDNDVCLVNADIRVANLVLLEYALDHLVVQVGTRLHARDDDPALLFDLEDDVWGGFVQANPEALELVFDYPLVLNGPSRVEDDADEIARSSDCNYLLAAPLSILSSLNDSRQIQELDFGSFVEQIAWNASQSGKLVGGNLGLSIGKLRE